MKQSRTTRRSFLKHSAAAATAGAVVGYFPGAQPAFAADSPNDRPGIGCIGVGSMGSGDAKGHAKYGDILAVCDVDAKRADKAKEDSGIGKGKADAYGECEGLSGEDITSSIEDRNREYQA